MPLSQLSALSSEKPTSAYDEKYKRLSNDMHRGLKDIYKHIHSSSDGAVDHDKTNMLFTEAAAQLSEVLDATQKATESIMETVEKQMDMQARMLDAVSALRKNGAGVEQLDGLENMVSELGADLIFVMTELSFQDLTGQRIKRVVNALKMIEETVLDLYLSSGLIMKGLEDSPEKNMDTIKSEAETVVRDLKEGKTPTSELKGPAASGSSQADIDDLLAQLGM